MATVQEEHGPFVRLASVPPGAWDQRFFQPVIDAEAARGNPGRIRFGDLHWENTFFEFALPIDVKAIRAEFELDDGMSIESRGGSVCVFYDGDAADEHWALAGSTRDRTPEQRHTNHEWWRAWRARPRPIRQLFNPFLHRDALPPWDPPKPVILDPPLASLEIVGWMPTTELIGLGRGWSVWSFQSRGLEGLVVLAPKWVADLSSAINIVRNAGGTELPVIVAIRGLEPPWLADAVETAGVATRFS